MTNAMPLKERFEQFVIKGEGCWGWHGAISNGGYAVIFIGNGTGGRTAAVASWIIHNGPVPDGFNVCHRCDNRKCTKPVGTIYLLHNYKIVSQVGMTFRAMGFS